VKEYVAKLGRDQARKELDEKRYGPTKITVYNYLLQLTHISPHSLYTILQIVEYLALDLKVPVDKGDLSGTTILQWCISTKPYFCKEFAQVMLKAGGDINQRNRYGATAGHDIATILRVDAESKQRTLDAMQFFVDNGGDIEMADGDGCTIRRTIESARVLIPALGAFVGMRTAPDAETRPQPKVRGEKLGRNDPCHCGKGKKFKNCCGKA